MSERLFSLTSEGGTEYVGRVMKAALDDLSWTADDDAMKLFFIAGNEAADQDPVVDFRDVTDLARRQGIAVHPIFCGKAEAEEALSWKELAEVALGRLATIDQHASAIAVESPFDGDLADLSAAINTTFIPLGKEGEEREVYIDGMRETREELRKQIVELSEERRKFVADRQKAKGATSSAGFDAVIREAIRSQAEEKGFQPTDR